MIEDPREEERREELAVENERGCSREDMAAALVDVSDNIYTFYHVLTCHKPLFSQILNFVI